MASQKTKFSVGLFVAAGIGIAIVAIIWLGVSRFFEKGQYYVAYFNESVQGLDKDSPVKYRGVSIGRVESIGVAPDSRLIQVVLKIESVQTLEVDIVAQLKSVGITGSMFVELDRKKKGEPDRSPPLSFPSEFPIVASKPSDISELLRGIDDVLNQIRSLDLGGISDKVKIALDSINQAIADANVKGISANIGSVISDAGRILDDERWDRIMVSVEEASQSLNTTMNKADRSMSRVKNTVALVEGVVVSKEKTIKAAIEGFRKAMENANLFLKKGTLLAGRVDGIIAEEEDTIKRTFEDFKMTLENINQAIADANIKGISTNIESASASIDHILDSERWGRIMVSVEEASQSLNAMMDKANRSMSLVEGLVSEKEEAIKAAIEDFKIAMENANLILKKGISIAGRVDGIIAEEEDTIKKTLENANLFLEKGASLVSKTDDSLDHLKNYLLVTGQNLVKASENLNQLIGLLADHPPQLLFGEPPSPRKVEPEIYKKK